MKNLENYGVQEMNAEEMVSVEGGDVSVVVITGIGDGIKGNTHLYVFGQEYSN